MAAVSIQLMPKSSARWMAWTDSLSSCAPQANCHPPPPMAQAPTPIGVISRSLEPSFRFCISLSWQLLLGSFWTPRLADSGAHAVDGRASTGSSVSLYHVAHCFGKSPDIGGFLDKLPGSQCQY